MPQFDTIHGTLLASPSSPVGGLTRLYEGRLSQTIPSGTEVVQEILIPLPTAGDAHVIAKVVSNQQNGANLVAGRGSAFTIEALVQVVSGVTVFIAEQAQDPGDYPNPNTLFQINGLGGVAELVIPESGGNQNKLVLELTTDDTASRKCHWFYTVEVLSIPTQAA